MYTYVCITVFYRIHANHYVCIPMYVLLYSIATVTVCARKLTLHISRTLLVLVAEMALLCRIRQLILLHTLRY